MALPHDTGKPLISSCGATVSVPLGDFLADISETPPDSRRQGSFPRGPVGVPSGQRQQLALIGGGGGKDRLPLCLWWWLRWLPLIVPPWLWCWWSCWCLLLSSQLSCWCPSPLVLLAAAGAVLSVLLLVPVYVLSCLCWLVLLVVLSLSLVGTAGVLSGVYRRLHPDRLTGMSTKTVFLYVVFHFSAQYDCNI